MKRKSSKHHHMLRHIKTKHIQKDQLIIWLAFVALIIIALIRVLSPVSAASIGSPYWREMTSTNAYWKSSSCSGGGDGGDPVCTDLCTAVTWGPFARFTAIYETGYYSDSSCTALLTNGSEKPVLCGQGEVMVGVRDYQHAYQVDEEHVDAYCAPVTGATVGAPSFYSAANAYETLYGGYKEVICPAGQVMSAVRMWGQYQYVDDEHVDVGCSSFSGSFSGNAQWVSAGNAWSRLEGGYKQAVCPAGQVMIGVRWYEWKEEIDEEHTDALCISLAAPATPIVNVYFSMK